MNHKMFDTNQVSGLRRILPQVIATTVENVHHINMGLSGAMPTIIIAALTAGIPNEHNRNEFLSLTAVQASWLGSMAFLILPFGSFASGFISDYLGRKRSMMFVNVPFIIGWLMLYRTTEIWHIFAGGALLTLGSSLVKAAMVNYVAEICEPSIRSILMGYSNTSISIGMFATYTLNTLMPWRAIALVGLATPLISAITLFFIPETPHWLLSKNRTEEAEKSLRWLRGWVSREAVAKEFSTLQQHSEHFKSCNSCIKQSLPCTHPPPTLTEKLSELKRKRTLKPFAILAPMFILTQFTGILAMQPFMMQILRAYESPVAPDKSVAFMSFLDNLAHVAFIFAIRFTGKRHLFLLMGTGVFVCALVVSCYGFMCLPIGYMSFNQQNQSFHLENANLSHIPMVCLFLWDFFSKFGFLAMPWMLLPELFPFKSRGVAIGTAVAVNFSLGFISRKTYYNLETTLSMAGVSLLYCIITGVGLILMYFILPETEGRSLEDIELHFSDNSKKLIDRKIAKSIILSKDIENCDKITTTSENID